MKVIDRFASPILLVLYTIVACYGVSAQRCPNATFTISCNITTPGPVTKWIVPPGYCSSNDITLLQSSGTNCGSKNDSCGPFVATNLVPPSGMACTASVLSVVAAPQLNGTNISCYSNEILQYQHVISITTPPGLPLVTVCPMGNGSLVVSCTPGANGDPPTSYDITVEPNGTHIITPSNGMVEQNIPGLLPNTTYTVRVIAINCAGSSGVVTVNAITVPPGLPLVTVRPMGNGLVVSCTPGANGDPPTSYDITVEPNGTHIITPSNGMVEQNIPGLLPNTTYTVRVIAINCAGSSGVVAVTATTANNATQPLYPSLTPGK
ncbi:hypothetical protein EMCRGX_G015381 [Ephydatia muelleri]